MGGYVLAAMEDTLALSLGSSFEGMVRIANTSSMLWEVYFSFEGSFGAIGGMPEPWTTSLLISFIFEVSSAYSASFEGVLAAGGALGRLPWTSPASEDTGLALVSEELEGLMAGG